MSIRASILSFFLKRVVKKQLANMDDVVALRNRMADSAKLGGSIPTTVSTTPQTINGVPCEWVTLEDTDQNRVLLYLHGGGYVLGSPDSHRYLAWKLAEASGMRVLVVDYRLAPENPFPAAVDDATNCYRWLLDDGFNPKYIAIGGDSAGGGLAAATMVQLRNLGLPQPNCGILLSPWTDLSLSGPSIESNANADVILSRAALEGMATHYLDERDRKAPLASPLFADLTGLPPLLIHVGSTEILLSDAEQLAEKLNENGGTARLEIWPKMPHVFQMFGSRIPEGRKAIDSLGEYLREHTR
ncbi:MAG: alpha/beta hydrolase [bacterium]|nr:alpha/beta hydrolase [Gammaproteobacteria bacterium]HIL95826.1 alpha/beta hydrolase [Pseudomonadales bacterium]